MKTDDLTKALEKIDALKSERSEQKEILDEIDREIDSARQVLLGAMSAHGLLTFKTDRFRVERKRALKVNIDDPLKLRQYFEQSNYDPFDYLALNTTGVKKIVQRAHKEDGELIPHTTITEDETLAITGLSKD